MPTITDALPVVTFQAWSASMSASGVPATPLTVWPELTQAPELSEGRVVRGRQRVHLVVGLREPDAGIAAEASKHGVQPGRIDPGELRRDAPQLPFSLCACRRQKLVAFGVRNAGSQSDDELRGRACDIRAAWVWCCLAFRRAGEQQGRCGYDKERP